jgi:putative aldouronate transport system substrate-binding protein
MKKLWLLSLSLALCLALAFCLASAAGAEKLVDTDVTITYMIPEHANQPLPQDAAVLDWIREATGITIDLMPVSGADWDQKASTLIAADTMPDIMDRIPAKAYTTYAAEGAFVAVSDHYDLMPAFKAFVDEDWMNMSKMYVGDKLYGIVHAGKPNNTSMGQEPMIRGDILESLGLAMPTNFDELLEVLRAFKAAYPDTYPWSIRNGVGTLVGIPGYMMGYGNAWYYDKDINDGEWAYGYTSPEFLKALEFFQIIYKESILDPDYVSTTAAQWQEKCSTGVCLFTFDNPTFNINFNTALKVDDPDAYFTYIPILTAWNGQQRGLRYTSSWYEPVVVSSSSKNIETCLKLLNWDYTDEGRLITNWGMEGVSYEVADGQKQALPSVYEAALKTSDPWRGFMGMFGLGHLGLATCVDESNQNQFLNEQTLSWYEYWQNEEALDPAALAPVFTDEENAKLADLKTAVNTIFDAEINKYIMGELPAADFAAVQQRLIEAGVPEALAIYNTAEKR